MFKHLLTRGLPVASMMLGAASPALAHDFEVDGIYYNIISDSEVEVTSDEAGTDYQGDIAIPANVTYSEKNYNVTKIGDYAFIHCQDLTSVTIPEGVHTIGEWAFIHCSALASITIPQSVEEITRDDINSCFSGTPFEENLPEGVVYLGKVLYSYKGEMPENTTIDIKEGTTQICGYAFACCDNYTSKNLIAVNIPNSVRKIGLDAFDNTAFYENQPDGVVYCGKVLYKYKGEMPENTSIDIEDGTMSITRIAFSGCQGLTSINIPNSVQYIGSSAFSECENLTSIVIPNGITAIEVGTFSECRNMVSISIPEGVTEIGNAAFAYCSNLASIDIPNSVSHIGSSAFYSCESLLSIDLPDSLTSIDDYTFEDCRNLTSVSIPQGVVSIGDYAFSGCRKLESINIPDNLTYMGTYALPSGSPFYENLPDGLLYFGKVLYKYKGDMPENTSIQVKDGTTCIGGGAFECCTNLISINIPESVTSIGNSAFRDCGGLTSVVIPNNVTKISFHLFQQCIGLTSVTIPASVNLIAEEAFWGCSALEHIYCHAETPAMASCEFAKDKVPVETCMLHVPAGSVDAYKATDGWNEFANIVGDLSGIVDIEANADAPIEYYDLSGRKVTQPNGGIFIKKQGKAASKILL